jgi:predicted nucleic acid-binding protein
MRNESNLDKIIISDTSCIIAFTNVNRLDILKNTFNMIEITPDVKKEYERKKEDVLPDWIIIKEPINKERVNKLKEKFGDGESESIVLAVEEGKKSRLVLDDLNARNYALDLGIDVMGTLGILNYAREKDILALDDAIDIATRMKKNKFRVSDELLNDFIEDMKTDDKIKKDKICNS